MLRSKSLNSLKALLSVNLSFKLRENENKSCYKQFKNESHFIAHVFSSNLSNHDTDERKLATNVKK